MELIFNINLTWKISKMNCTHMTRSKSYFIFHCIKSAETWIKRHLFKCFKRHIIWESLCRSSSTSHVFHVTKYKIDLSDEVFYFNVLREHFEWPHWILLVRWKMQKKTLVLVPKNQKNSKKYNLRSNDRSLEELQNSYGFKV